MQQGLIQWFNKAHIDQSGIQLLSSQLTGTEQWAKGQNSQLFTLTHNPALTYGQQLHRTVRRYASATATRIAHCSGARVLIAGIQHLPAFIFIRRHHQHHIGDAANKANIKSTLMGWAVSAHYASAINSKQHIQILQRDVVYKLVVTALQKAGVNRSEEHTSELQS